MANVIEFTIKGVDKFSRPMSSVASSVTTVAKAATGLGLSLAATGAASVVFMKQFTDTQDAVAKFSDRIGVAVEDLSAYQYAANISGISTEQFNMAVQRMTRRVAEASIGTGEATGALQELGINAQAFKSLELDQQMTVLADAMEGVGTQADKTRLAMKLFDSEGVAMLQMLNEGSTEMQALAADAAFLGQVFSSQAAANSEKFNDELTRLGRSISGVGNALTNEFAPIFTPIFRGMANTIAESREAIVKWAQSAFRSFVAVGMIAQQMYNTWKDVFSSSKGLKEFLLDFATFMGNFVTTIGKLVLYIPVVFFTAFSEAFKAITKIVVDFGLWIGGAIRSWFSKDKMEPFKAAMTESFLEAMQGAADNITAVMDPALESLRNSAVETGTSLADVFNIDIDAAYEKADLWIEKMREMGTAAVEEAENIDASYMNFYDNIKKEHAAFFDQMQRSGQTFVKTWYKTIQNTVKGISDAIGSTIVYGGNLMEEFKNITKGVIASIISMLVQMGIERLIFSTLTRGLVTGESAREGAKAVGLAGANMFASWAAAPWPISLGAPAAASAAIAGASGALAAGQGAGAAVGGAVGGIFDAGQTYVPRNNSYMLSEGERILSPQQNADLTRFLEEVSQGGGGGGVSIENLNIEILPNATSAETLTELDQETWRDIVAGPIIDALNSLNRRGIKPEFAD